MNKTLETQNPKNVWNVVNAELGELLVRTTDRQSYLIEDMPLYLVIKISQKSTGDLYTWYLLLRCYNNCTQLIETYSAPRWNKNDDVILHNHVRLSDLLPLND